MMYKCSMHSRMYNHPTCALYPEFWKFSSVKTYYWIASRLQYRYSTRLNRTWYSQGLDRNILNIFHSRAEYFLQSLIQGWIYKRKGIFCKESFFLTFGNQINNYLGALNGRLSSLIELWSRWIYFYFILLFYLTKI